jgi:hypothetical protein
MDSLLTGLAFAAFVLVQFAAIVAVHSETRGRRSQAFDASRFDHRTRAIWDSGS